MDDLLGQYCNKKRTCGPSSLVTAWFLVAGGCYKGLVLITEKNVTLKYRIQLLTLPWYKCLDVTFEDTSCRAAEKCTDITKVKQQNMVA